MQYHPHPCDFHTEDCFRSFTTTRKEYCQAVPNYFLSSPPDRLEMNGLASHMVFISALLMVSILVERKMVSGVSKNGAKLLLWEDGDGEEAGGNLRFFLANSFIPTPTTAPPLHPPSTVASPPLIIYLGPENSIYSASCLQSLFLRLIHDRKQISIFKVLIVFHLGHPLGSAKTMWRQVQNLVCRASAKVTIRTCPSVIGNRKIITGYGASSPSLSIWRRKKEIGKEGLIVAKELKRLQGDPLRFERFMKSHVSRLLKSDLVAVLAEFQRQDLVFLSMKLYDVVRKEIWYRPDMFFYRDMLMMLARNKRVDEAKRVWEDLKNEQVLFDQHTFGDLVRAFLDSRLPAEAMDIYEEMRRSPEPPLSLPYRVMLKGLVPYPELREKVKEEFLKLFPDMIVYDPPEDLFDDDEHWK
ncbi:hypothetical protein M9H77_00948 [Catharanthus roseus]|uniref:Uncharacterized protein n=1 Tax=Catharanthus roseus TaxID=4058 RepID=A0ACC0C4K4_CATRO|nr:hypothetical protein M9H77_00948 [Catharanthus roseus]